MLLLLDVYIDNLLWHHHDWLRWWVHAWLLHLRWVYARLLLL